MTLDGTYNPFIDFNFTGTMKPLYPLSPKRKVPDHIPKPDYAADGRVILLMDFRQ
jgi:methionyl aminopeptidase